MRGSIALRTIVAVGVLLVTLFAYQQKSQSADMWLPAPTTQPWQYQLTGTIDAAQAAVMFDIDGFEAPQAKIDTLKTQGKSPVCYMSTGSWENWRPDASSFPASVKGNSNGWPGEKWLDIRQISTLRPIMESRADICLQKGFVAIEWDNVDGYANNSGFPLTYADQIAYNEMLASVAHARGLSVGLKNDVDQVPDLVDNFDFAVVEECHRYRECPGYKPFVNQNKAVFQVEYNLNNWATKCQKAAGRQFSLIVKDLDLTAFRKVC
jgi:hypothetical protein